MLCVVLSAKLSQNDIHWNGGGAADLSKSVNINSEPPCRSLSHALLCVHSKQDVSKEGPPTGGGADPAAPTRGGADPATSTNSTGAKGKLLKTSVRHALYNI